MACPSFSWEPISTDSTARENWQANSRSITGRTNAKCSTKRRSMRSQIFRQALKILGTVHVPQSGKLGKAPAERGDAPAGFGENLRTSPGNAAKQPGIAARKADQ